MALRAIPQDVLGVLGLKSVLLEGGAETARRFLDAGVVDRIRLFASDVVVGDDGVLSPVTRQNVPEEFVAVGESLFGGDRLIDYERAL